MSQADKQTARRVRGLSATADQMTAKLRDELRRGGDSLVNDVQCMLRSLAPLSGDRTFRVVLLCASLGLMHALASLANTLLDEEEASR
jgi:hypothetical protein